MNTSEAEVGIASTVGTNAITRNLQQQVTNGYRENMHNNRIIESVFSHAYVLGGSPCSGKSTIAERLSSQYDLQYYKVDDHEQAHMSRCRPDRHPVMSNFSKMGWNEIWSRPVSIQVEDEFEFYRERFGMIVDDLREFDLGKSIVLEGAAYLPELINECGVAPEKVLYLVPTKEFQLHHYSKRPWIEHILADCDDPDQAFDNWMMRDHLFGLEILRQAEVYGLRSIFVDGKTNMDTTVGQVVDHFGLS